MEEKQTNNLLLFNKKINFNNYIGTYNIINKYRKLLVSPVSISSITENSLGHKIIFSCSAMVEFLC